MDIFGKKPAGGNNTSRGDYQDEKIKTLLVAVIVGVVVLIALMISIKLIREGKNPFDKSAVSADSGGEETSETETDNVTVAEAQQEKAQQEKAQQEKAQQEKAQQEKAQQEKAQQEKAQSESTESFGFEEACMVGVSRRLTDDDIDAIYRYAPGNLPETPIQMAINYIYAWHGYHFNTDEIREYFLDTSWYKDKGKTIDECNAEMDSIEKDNVKKLVSLR